MQGINQDPYSGGRRYADTGIGTFGGGSSGGMNPTNPFGAPSVGGAGSTSGLARLKTNTQNWAQQRGGGSLNWGVDTSNPQAQVNSIFDQPKPFVPPAPPPTAAPPAAPAPPSPAPAQAPEPPPVSPYANIGNLNARDVLGQYSGDPTISQNAQTTQAWGAAGIPMEYLKTADGQYIARRTDNPQQQSPAQPQPFDASMMQRNARLGGDGGGFNRLLEM